MLGMIKKLSGTFEDVQGRWTVGNVHTVRPKTFANLVHDTFTL
jgi:hypothetical protein